MSNATAKWFSEFAAAAAETDRFVGKPDHVALLAAGLIGEAGSIVAEFKKEQRELDAYPVYRNRMLEEVGDFLWYFSRLVSLLEPRFLDDIDRAQTPTAESVPGASRLTTFLQFGAAAGEILRAIALGEDRDEIARRLRDVWSLLSALSRESSISIVEAAKTNTLKTRSRWLTERTYRPLFDDGLEVEEQLPRLLQIEFKEHSRGPQKVVMLRCNGINFGDRLTDNIREPDWYRFHDIFHFAYAVHLGWSPVVRSLLRCKRKSIPAIDEGEDGARAAIIEEAVAAIVFSRAKHLEYFARLDHVDLDLLKTVKEFVEGFEVEDVPLWQWEVAILDGYRVFRLLRDGPGGRVKLDLAQRRLDYSAVSGEPSAEDRRVSGGT